MWALTLRHLLAAFKDLALTNTHLLGRPLGNTFTCSSATQRWCYCQTVYVIWLSDLTA